MIDKLKQSIQQAGDLIKEQANQISESAKEKGYQLIEEWVTALPKFEENNLEITSFALGVSINPSLEVELKGNHQDFAKDRIEEILKENFSNGPIRLVFNTIKTTYNLHEKAKCELQDPLIVKIKVKLSPEIKVFIGQPLII